MKVLLFTNLTYDSSITSGGEQAQFGGWLTMIAAELDRRGISVGFVFRAGGVEFNPKIDTEGSIQYYALSDNHKTTVSQIASIYSDYKPDVVHLEGTEYPHSKYVLELYPEKTLLGLQGIISGYIPHYFGHVFRAPFFNKKNFFHLIASLTVFLAFIKFRKRKNVELETLKLARYVMGRTDWDRAYAEMYAADAKYFHVKRLIRYPFLSTKHSPKDTRTIFVSNPSRALKGFHTLLVSLTYLKLQGLNLKIRVAGPKPTGRLVSRLGYSGLLIDFIKRNDLGNDIQYLGNLSAEEMAGEMASASLVTITSNIENSPNTLIEAMHVGVPVVTSYVGGVASMANPGTEVLYFRAGDSIMLASMIRKILTDYTESKLRAERARTRVLNDYNYDQILSQLNLAYDSVCLSSKLSV